MKKLLGVLLGYEKSLRDARDIIERMRVELSTQAKLIHRLTAQVRKLGGKPEE